MDFPGYVITLRRATNRRQQVEKIIATCPVQCSAIDAVDGAQLSTSELSKVYRRHIHRPNYPFTLRKGEIGCFLSHRNLWQTMVSQSLPLALVVEDDIEFQLPAFEQTLRVAAEQVKQGEYVQFQVRDLGMRDATAVEEIQIVKPKVIPLRTSAQLLTLEAARRLLAASETFDRPVDVFLQMNWLTRVNVLVAVPSNVVERSADLGGSTIGSKSRPFADRLRHEIMRPIYRSRIAIESYRRAS